MLARQSIVRHFVRNASTKSDRITVQLLTDFHPLGAAGELVRVKPAFMRNFLHVDNKACYITKDHGPRIPVVEKKRETIEVKAKAQVNPAKVVQEEAPASTGPALSLDELSNLFSNMRMSKGKSAATAGFQTSEAAPEIAYSLAELGESLPATYTLPVLQFPVSREELAKVVFNSTGIEVPAAAIKITVADGAVVDEIATAGIYTWAFLAPGDASTLKRKLKVQ